MGNTTRRTESGMISMKAILYLAFIAAVIFACFKIIPVYVNNYQLNDYIQSQTPFWLTQRATVEGIKKVILAKAADLDLPVAADDITVVANQNIVKISIDYHVPVDLKVYTLQLHFTPASENRSII